MSKLYRVIFLKKNDSRRYVTFHRALNRQQAVAITKNTSNDFRKCVAVYDDTSKRPEYM